MTKVLFKRKTSDEIATLPVEDGALIYNRETGATYLDYGNERIPTGGGMPTGDTFPIGAITSYAGDTAPVNWLICDGRAISRITYADLFDAIGTTYGVGDGSTTFNLPNLKGRVVTGLDSSQTEFDTLGEAGGEKTHTLTVSEMPAHKHLFKFTKEIATPATGSGEIFFGKARAWNMGDNGNITEDSGGGAAHNILQPYITLNYIIKAFQSSGTVANVATIETNSDTDTYSCNYINSMDKYSTDEVKTNRVWIDGKPIYKKTFVFNTTINPGTEGRLVVSHNISNVNNIWIDTAHSFIKASTTTTRFPLPLLLYNGQIDAIYPYVNNTAIYIESQTAWNENWTKTITLEYTKTTD